MMEAISVIFIVFILIIIGIYFYYSTIIDTIQEEGQSGSLISNTVLLSFIPTMPELTCTNYQNCIDIFKLFAFTQYSKNNPNLLDDYPILRGKIIRFRQLYPPVNQDNCTIEKLNDISFPSNCDTYYLVEGPMTRITSTPISLYVPSKDLYVLGLVEVSG